MSTSPASPTSSTSSSSSSRKPFAFLSYPAMQKLQELAKQPYDLTAPNNLPPERLKGYAASGCGYKFLYGTERVDGRVLVAFQQLADEAKLVDKMKRMQSGEVMNALEGIPSENRAVLHTAVRDFFDEPQKAQMAAALTAKAKQEHERLKAFLDEVNADNRFTTMVCVAIGGSDLGPKALSLALEVYRKPNRSLKFVSNIDPDDLLQAVEDLDLSKTLVLVVSKSGTTIETVTNETFLRELFKSRGLKTEEHFICVTEEGSPMDDSKRYLACFHMWDCIGGRFSASSMVGCVSLGFAYGYEVVWEFLAGCHDMDRHALNTNVLENLPLLGALLTIWNHHFLHIQTLAFIPYSHALSRFSAHLQQVEMESNGKRIDKKGHPVPFQTGPIIWGEPGTSAQHSFYQLIHQGTIPIALEFVGFAKGQREGDLEIQGTTSQEKLLANLFAQMLALATGKSDTNPNKVFPGNRPSHLLLAKQLTPYALGVLFAYLEHKVVFEGFLWDINSFDQEGVQLGKVLATRIAEQIRAKREQEKVEPFPQGSSLLDILCAL